MGHEAAGCQPTNGLDCGLLRDHNLILYAVIYRVCLIRLGITAEDSVSDFSNYMLRPS